MFHHTPKSLWYKISIHHVIWITALSLPAGPLVWNNNCQHELFTEFSFLLVLSQIGLSTQPAKMENVKSNNPQARGKL